MRNILSCKSLELLDGMMRGVVHELFDKFNTLMVREAAFGSPFMSIPIEVLQIVSEKASGR